MRKYWVKVHDLREVKRCVRVLRYYKEIRYALVEASKGDIDSLLKAGVISSVSRPTKVQTASDGLNPLEEGMVELDKLRMYGHDPRDERRVKVAVLDSGVWVGHPFFRGKRVIRRSFVNEGPDDLYGHGTGVSGIVLDGADFTLYHGKVLNRKGYGYDLNVLDGLRWAVRAGVHVINLSLRTDNDDENSPIGEMIRYAVRRGVTVVCSAGNLGPGRMKVPAKMSETITVGALNRDGEVAGFSSTWRNKPDVYAPGVDVKIPFVGRNLFIRASGTSFATPFVTRAVGYLIALTGVRKPSLLKQAIRKTALVREVVRAEQARYN